MWPEDPWTDHDSFLLGEDQSPDELADSLGQFGIECRNLSHACLDYNNVIVVFSRSYEVWVSKLLPWNPLLTRAACS